jgi:hypothetical protein
MVSRDIFAQLHQDITTAEDAGDESTAARLRAELEAAMRQEDGDQEDTNAQ